MGERVEGEGRELVEGRVFCRRRGMMKQMIGGGLLVSRMMGASSGPGSSRSLPAVLCNPRLAGPNRLQQTPLSLSPPSMRWDVNQDLMLSSSLSSELYAPAQ